ncbi:MAG: hypothetical protein ACE5HD_08030 [Acidobacteriota bacterium]
MGLLLLVAVGASFVPGGTQRPAAGTLLMEAMARGDLRARFFSIAPPLLSFIFAWRASGRLTRSFRRLPAVLVVASLSAAAVLIAFHLGFFLALQTHSIAFPPPPSLWKSTLPGALMGWVLLLVVTGIRWLSHRADHELKAVREHLSRHENSP